MTGRPRKGRPASFTTADGVVPARALDDNLTGLHFVVQPRTGNAVLIDFRDLEPRPFALAAAQAIRRRSEIGGPTGTDHGVKAHNFAIRIFCQYLSTGMPRIRQSGEIEPRHLDDFESWLEAQGRSRTYVYAIMRRTVVILREIADEDAGAVSSNLVHRLRYVSERPVERSRPRDAYSPGVARQLRNAARTDIAKLHKRIDGCLPPWLAKHKDSSVREAAEECHRIISEAGWLSSQSDKFYRLQYLLRSRGEDASMLLDRLHERFYLLRTDVTATLVLFGLDVGMEIECIRGLRTDCLVNPSSGTVGVAYRKLRASGSAEKRLRVRDGGPATPGGLLRLVLSSTRYSRQWHQSELLIQFYGGRAFHEGAGLGRDAIRSWIAQHCIVDDHGAPLRFTLSRLRKTHKALWYRTTEGHMGRFAVGHTIKVAAQHYADIPSLRPLHEAAISDALWQASGMGGSKDDAYAGVEKIDQKLAPKPNNGASGHEPASYQSGTDVWLASCSNFYSGPFSKNGAACRQPFWGCLDCRNAVITERKLPALLAFCNFIIEQRKVLAAAEWAQKFGHVHSRIVRQILPSFPQGVVDAARAEMAFYTPRIYLPPEAIQ